ncbi:MAG: lipid-A-disaccharide synthase N-terminal domain-containing protein [Parachlamydiaceae bacterium]
MSEHWREFLYPLGFLAAIAFTSRMLIQWLTSERKGRSVVVPAFWRLSLCGNVLLAVHAFIQMQFHVCLVQVCNSVISWRNLNLMQPSEKQVSKRYTVGLLAAAVLTIVVAFAIQGHFVIGNDGAWFRVPSTPWQDNANLNISWGWHLLGFIGLLLFGSRFWIQWWYAEKRQTSYLGRAFWWTSLVGEGMCLLYFLQIHDPVNFIGPAFGIIPYIRNLMLIYRKNTLEKAHEVSI